MAEPIKYRLGVWSIVLAIVAGGCSQPQELVYVPAKDVSKLPEKQRTQLQQRLEEYFGTPRFPKFMEVAAEQPAEAKEPLLQEHIERRHLEHGREVFTRQCAGCHGVTGDGNGPAAAYLNPPPRDYRLGKFKFNSTPRGSKPRRDDLVRVIRAGAKGTSMPAFRFMADDDLQAVIDYVILLSSRGELEYRVFRTADEELDEADDISAALAAKEAQRIAKSWQEADAQIVRPLTPEPQYTQESIEAGAKAFVQLNCYKCHGRDGRGNKAFNVGKDDWGRTAYAADLTAGTLHGGRRPVDLYRRIYSGINGTPMPAFAQPDATKNETATERSETIWRLTHFITSIVEGKPFPDAVVDAEILKLESRPAVDPGAE